MNLEKLAQTWFNLYTIRKYPLCRYILGVIIQTTSPKQLVLLESLGLICLICLKRSCTVFQKRLDSKIVSLQTISKGALFTATYICA